MRKQWATVVAVALGLLALAALARGVIGWAQGPGDGPGTVGASSANIPAGLDVTSPPDLPAGIKAEDIEAAAAYNASLRILGSALKPRDSDVEWASSGSGGCVYPSSGDQYTVFNTPVYLPQGSTVKYMRMYFNDTNTSYNSAAWFTAYEANGDIADEWVVQSTGSAGAGFSTSDEFTHTVDYEAYSYVVNWRPWDLGSDMQLCGFRIYYHTPPGAAYVPVAFKGYSSTWENCGDAREDACRIGGCGAELQAYPNDTDDWYAFDLGTVRAVTARATDVLPASQLLLYDSAGQLLVHDGSSSSTKTVSYTLQRGYVRVYTPSGQSPTALYTLSLVCP